MKLNNIINRWSKLSARERFRFQALFICFIIVIYGAVFYPLSRQKLTKAEGLLSRQLDRTKKRTVDAPTDVLSPQTVAKKIERVDEELNSIRTQFDELDSGFAPIDSTESRQLLMLEISSLAERTGVELLSASSKGFSPGKDPGQPKVDPVIGRPLLEITANADYHRLMSFLSGLRELSFYVSVMKIKINSRYLDKEQPKYMPPGAISISMEMAV